MKTFTKTYVVMTIFENLSAIQTRLELKGGDPEVIAELQLMREDLLMDIGSEELLETACMLYLQYSNEV